MFTDEEVDGFEIKHKHFLENDEIACWGHNKPEKCCWVRFGYGSRWDMICCCQYYKGYWACEEVIKLLLYYDFSISEEQLEHYNVFHFSDPELENRKLDFLSYSGGFMRDNPDYCRIETDCTGHEYKEYLPKRDEIKNFNVEHHKLLRRLDEISCYLAYKSDTVNTFVGPMSKEDWENSRTSLEDLKRFFEED